MKAEKKLTTTAGAPVVDPEYHDRRPAGARTAAGYLVLGKAGPH